MLPDAVAAPLKLHLARVKALHNQDLAEGFGEVYLPFALDKKYPNAHKEWADNIFFYRSICPSTRARAKRAAIISTKRACNAR